MLIICFNVRYYLLRIDAIEVHSLYHAWFTLSYLWIHHSWGKIGRCDILLPPTLNNLVISSNIELISRFAGADRPRSNYSSPTKENNEFGIVAVAAASGLSIRERADVYTSAFLFSIANCNRIRFSSILFLRLMRQAPIVNQSRFQIRTVNLSFYFPI